MFELADDGFRSLFEQLVACIVSIRTYDEVTVPLCRRLFAAARMPRDLARLPAAEIDRLISPSTFHENKARQIRDIAARTEKEFGGELPCDYDVLTSFPGVGPKCANLALGIACGQPRVAVDVHVHRVVNRWGIVSARTPEDTMEALDRLLPDALKVTSNRILMPFGKHICTGRLPACSTCPVLDMCRQVGVTKHR